MVICSTLFLSWSVSMKNMDFVKISNESVGLFAFDQLKWERRFWNATNEICIPAVTPLTCRGSIPINESIFFLEYVVRVTNSMENLKESGNFTKPEMSGKLSIYSGDRTLVLKFPRLSETACLYSYMNAVAQGFTF